MSPKKNEQDDENHNSSDDDDNMEEDVNASESDNENKDTGSKRRSERGSTSKPKAKTVTYDDGIARKVFIVHKSIDKDDWNKVTTMLLPHPKTQANALFLFDTRKDETKDLKYFVYEILTMIEEDGLSSWFIGNSVSSNGNLYVFTPVDPLYLVLPAMAQSKLAKPFMDHLIEYFPLEFAEVINGRLLQDQLLNISIKKVSGDVEAFAYEETKVLNWLTKKVEAVTKYFSGTNLTRSEASISCNFSRAATSDSASTEEYRRYACDLVCEYLDDVLKAKLQNALGIPTDSERPKRKNSDIEEGSKRLKLENGEGNLTPLEDYGSSIGASKTTSKGPSTTKQKQLQQAAKGTHSLLKFFTPKSKTK